METSGPEALYVYLILALLSERCNFVQIIATKIFTGTIFVENCMRNIFGDVKFSSKVHISRENREKVIAGSCFDALDQVGPR